MSRVQSYSEEILDSLFHFLLQVLVLIPLFLTKVLESTGGIGLLWKVGGPLDTLPHKLVVVCLQVELDFLHQLMHDPVLSRLTLHKCPYQSTVVRAVARESYLAPVNLTLALFHRFRFVHRTFRTNFVEEQFQVVV